MFCNNQRLTKKIAICGCPGSGKSTLALELGNLLHLPVYHLDKYFFDPGWVEVDRETFVQRHTSLISREKWIIDGNYGRTLPSRAEQADIIIQLDISRLLCLKRAFVRMIKNYGTTRPDLTENCPERFDPEFFLYIWNYKRDSQQKHQQVFEQYRKKLITLSNIKQVAEFKRNISTCFARENELRN